ncbi:hypothetical protein AB0C38_10395 [Amycolatopsis sp. NPDC048633]|uniref:hypothetical protein n=1 Tax=Amycolatopsis sp. NPDC048633 TaxID=3157095 RepID=UPI0034042CF9
MKRWQLTAAAVAVATAVSLTNAPAALANPPGESNSWQPEKVGGNDLYSSDTMDEASHGTELVQVYRNNDFVWFSFNHGAAFRVGVANTQVAPRVITTREGYAAFHTGIDGNIYWSRTTQRPELIRGAPGTWGPWTRIGGQTTNQSVSAVATNQGIMMVYRGSGNDTRVFQSWFDFGSGQWQAAAQINGGNSPSAPTVTYNPVFGEFAAVIRGQSDNRVYLSYQHFGQPQWTPWSRVRDVTVASSPTIAATANGDMIIVGRDTAGHLHLTTVNRSGGFEQWSDESTHWQALTQPSITVLANLAFLILTGLNHQVFYKQVYKK